MLSRRAFLGTTAAACALLGARPARLKIGSLDLVFRMAGKPEVVGIAKELGLAAVQLTIAKSTDGKTLPLEDPALLDAWLAASKQHGIPLNATYLESFQVDCLKNNPIAPMWVQKGIEITKKLGAQVLMPVFFGKCEVLQRTELDYVIGLFKELAPEAERAGVIIGVESTNSGEDCRYACDKVNSKAFKVWYDVGNSTFGGFDAPAEIRALGRDRICMFHFKDRGYLGEGKVNMPEVLRAIEDIKFEGYAHLETKSPSGDVLADTKRNLAYLRKLMDA
jgi:L-ribulose-5-phosphate 3-epimerase